MENLELLSYVFISFVLACMFFFWLGQKRLSKKHWERNLKEADRLYDLAKMYYEENGAYFYYA